MQTLTHRGKTSGTTSNHQDGKLSRRYVNSKKREGKREAHWENSQKHLSTTRGESEGDGQCGKKEGKVGGVI